MSRLTSVNFNGASVSYNIDFVNCPNLTTIDLRNTRASITLNDNNKVSTLRLGSPTTVSITGP